MAIIFTDNFDRADSTNLGANWTERSAGVGDWGISGNQLRALTGQGGSCAYASGAVPPNADYEVQSNLSNDSGFPYAGITIRTVPFGTNDADYYFFLWAPGTLRFYLRQSGNWTMLGNIGDNEGNPINTVLKLKAVGNNIKAYKGGALKFDITNSALTAKGTGGVAQLVANTIANYDNFTIDDGLVATVNANSAFILNMI